MSENLRKFPVCPQIGLPLLQHLKKQFPVQYPKPAADDRSIWIGRGRLDVMEYLEAEYLKQEKSVQNVCIKPS